ncbi:uncharacterized protein KY384_004529 [Bacidia gigantensis]|uniref:uncharacterized protein n=1 Tax=Bacidia gigantensis TaxID=2732470 RepID=UPI001D059982|nr:uncharacterized protein KY384_004529 [Bacidia gigantensis]KAG8531171.1 hypothetical protein KY384_004529 [Bacidia gigantensis]
MPWRPLPRIAVAVAIYPFAASFPSDLPLEIGDDLYIIEQGGKDESWYRGYLVAPPSLLAGLTSGKGKTLEARVFSGIFPRRCVEIREHLGDASTEGLTLDLSIGGESPRVNQTNGDTPGSRSPSVQRNLMHPKASGKKIERGDEDTHSDLSGIGGVHLPNGKESTAAHNLSRTLSLHSIRSANFRNSPDPFLPTVDAQRDPSGKRPQAPVPMLKIGDETPTSTTEPLVDEIASCLREWHSTNLHELLLARQYPALDKISSLVKKFDIARRQLLYGVLTARELVKLREDTVWHLVNGNKLLSDEVIVRDPKENGRLLTTDDSPFGMSKLQSSMSLLERPPPQQAESLSLHHLLVELKSFVAKGLHTPTLTLYLCNRQIGGKLSSLTEVFAIERPFEASESEDLTSRIRTLFPNLTSGDIGDASQPEVEIYLVVRVRASEPIQSVVPSSRQSRQNDDDTRLRPNTGNAGLTALKTGRQSSIAWAQKSFGSVRSKSHESRPSLVSGTSDSLSSPAVENANPLSQENLQPITQPSNQYVRRNLGVGVVNLKNIFQQSSSSEHIIPIWTPARSFSEDPGAAKGQWEEVVRDLIPSKSGMYARVKGIEQISLSLESLHEPNLEDLANKAPTLLQNIPQTQKIDFAGAPKQPRSDIYVTIKEACLPHSALLSHPERGTVQLPSNLDLKNIQLTLEVRKRSGARIEDCIVPGSDSSPLKAWRSTAVERDEPWNQMIRLSIPVEDVPEAHLIMSVADAPGFPFALAWMPLWTESAFMKDGTHAPLLYLYDKATSSNEHGRGAYLNFPWSSRGPYGDEKDENVTGPVASLKVETKLCSTFFSQDKTLLGILNWRLQSKVQTLGLVKRISFVPEIEIVKLIGDVLDALFSILVNSAGDEEHEDAAFAALVITLGIVYDRRFNLEPYVDEYAETRFDHPYAAPCLIRAYNRLLTDHLDSQRSRRVRAAFKVGRHLIKFILCARTQQQAKEAGIGATTLSAFKRDLKGIFISFEGVVKDPSPALIGNKALIVQHIPTWLPELKSVFSEEEILQLACNFVEACREVQGQLIMYKLVLVLKLLDITLFSQEHVRSRIVSNTFKWLDPYWGFCEEASQQYREQVRLCCSIVSRQAVESGFDGQRYLEKILQTYSTLAALESNNHGTFSPLFPLTYPFPAKTVISGSQFDEAMIELAALIASLTNQMFTDSADASATEMAGLTSHILNVVTSILSNKAFPKSWLSLHVYHHKSMLQVLETTFNVMETKLVPSPEEADTFNTDLWNSYLKTLLLLVRSDTLALETFPEQKRRAVWKIAGDVREQGSALLKRSWEAIGWDTGPEDHKRYGLSHLGGFQVQYVPGLVSPIVELCLSVHQGLRGVAVRIIQSMVISEWTLNEDLGVVQAEIIESLDNLYKSRDVSNTLVAKMFVNEFLDAFQELTRMPLDPLWQAIRDMVSIIDELLELLAAVHSGGTDDSMKTMDTLLLMNFYKDMQKEDIFIRYVHQLADMQKELGNKTEAGLALQLHADLYTWESTKVRSLEGPSYPEQSSFERKEQLNFEMIRCFEEGSAWDCALASYRELATQYEHVYFEFAKLARTQRAMATIYETVGKGDWSPPRYFRVIFLGLGFQPNLRDRQYIYQAEAQEKQSMFTDRMRQSHPSAQILLKSEPEDMEGQYLQVQPVSIHRDLELSIYQQSKVAQSTREYVTSSSPYRFAVTSKRHSPISGVQDQWIEKTIYTTKETFPTILRRSEIVAINTVQLTPLQTAVERTSRKTAELATFEKRVISGDEAGFSNMTEAIISSVDPNSVATVAQYRQLLDPVEPVEEEEISEPQPQSPMQNALQIALLDHVSMLKHCLSLYTGPLHTGTHSSLSSNLHHTFAPEIALLQPPIQPQAEPELQDLLSTPPPSTNLSPGLSSFETSRPLTNGSSAPPPDSLSPTTRPTVPKSRISFNALKNSLQSSTQNKQPNGSVSAPSEGDSSSRSHSHSTAQVTPLGSTTSSTPFLTNGSGGSVGVAGGALSPARKEVPRPPTSQSSRSSGTPSKMKKRLSMLGITRMGSQFGRGGGKVNGMSALGEE